MGGLVKANQGPFKTEKLRSGGLTSRLSWPVANPAYLRTAPNPQPG